MDIPAIIFSFELKNGVIIDVKEHSSLQKASWYIGFNVKEKPKNGTRYITQWLTKSRPDSIYLNAQWVVDLTYFDIPGHKLTKPLADEKIVWEALNILKRNNSLDILLDDDN